MLRHYNTLTLDAAKQILLAAEAKAKSLGIAYNIAVVVPVGIYSHFHGKTER